MWPFIKSFLPAWLATFLVASVLHTFLVLTSLSNLGIEITASEWMSTTWQDIVGLLPTYGAIIAVALFLGLNVVTLVRKYLVKKVVSPTTFIVLTSLAGASGIAAALLAMQPILNVTLIAGARGYEGFLLQCSAGLLGGFLFGFLRSNISHRPHS